MASGLVASYNPTSPVEILHSYVATRLFQAKKHGEKLRA